MENEEALPSTSHDRPAREDGDGQSDKGSQKSNSEIDKGEEESSGKLVSRTPSSENSAIDGIDIDKATDAHTKMETKSGHHHQVRRGRIDKRARGRHSTAPLRQSQRLIVNNERLARQRESEELINKEKAELEDVRSSGTSHTPSENSGEVGVKVERAKSDRRAKRQRKRKPSKRRGRGRIVKPTRPRQSRQRTRRAIKHEKAVKKREHSQDTVQTAARLSSVDSLDVHGCTRCGHRCCTRRYKYKARTRITNGRTRVERIDVEDVVTSSRRVQVGSRCAMLSPLCVNATVPEPENQKHLNACEITPEMIIEAMQRLTMWRMEITTQAILNDIKRNYPVGNDERLTKELEDKLSIAVIVGMVERTTHGRWLLSSSLMMLRKPLKTHVSWFWRLYRDTMKPVTRAEKPEQETQGQDTNKDSNVFSNIKYQFT